MGTTPPEALVFANGFADLEALTEDLDIEFGAEQWNEIEPNEIDQALLDVHGETAFAIFAISDDEESSVESTAGHIKKAREAGLTVLLIVGEISSRAMHRLIREGVAEFMPYPEPMGALPDAINRLRLARSTNAGQSFGLGGNLPSRRGRVIAAYGVAGGVGASTFIVNMSWELAQLVRKQGRKVALLDFNFQYGSVATYLDVPRREAVYELVSEASTLDATGLTQALSTFQDRLHVLTAPRDALPLDIVSPSDVSAIIDLARETFDYVLIDMPQALMNWSEQVYAASDDFFALMEIDMRSAQNMFRFLRTLKAEDMDLTKVAVILNRAPGITDLSGKSRVKRVSESLGVEFAGLLPDGGRQVANACDQGVPLSESARSSALRKEITRLAQKVLDKETAESGKDAKAAE